MEASTVLQGVWARVQQSQRGSSGKGALRRRQRLDGAHDLSDDEPINQLCTASGLWPIPLQPDHAIDASRQFLEPDTIIRTTGVSHEAPLLRNNKLEWLRVHRHIPAPAVEDLLPRPPAVLIHLIRSELTRQVSEYIATRRPSKELATCLAAKMAAESAVATGAHHARGPTPGGDSDGDRAKPQLVPGFPLPAAAGVNGLDIIRCLGREVEIGVDHLLDIVLSRWQERMTMLSRCDLEWQSLLRHRVRKGKIENLQVGNWLDVLDIVQEWLEGEGDQEQGGRHIGHQGLEWAQRRCREVLHDLLPDSRKRKHTRGKGRNSNTRTACGAGQKSRKLGRRRRGEHEGGESAGDVATLGEGAIEHHHDDQASGDGARDEIPANRGQSEGIKVPKRRKRRKEDTPDGDSNEQSEAVDAPTSRQRGRKRLMQIQAGMQDRRTRHDIERSRDAGNRDSSAWTNLAEATQDSQEDSDASLLPAMLR